MGVVKINDEYQVEVDENCFSIQRKKISKKEVDGVEVVTEKFVNLPSYHHTWNGVFDALIERFVAQKVDEKEFVNLKELLQIYKEVRNEVREILNPLIENK